MNKKTIATTLLGIATASFIGGISVSAEDPSTPTHNPTLDGTSSVSFTGKKFDDGGLILVQVPSFSFGSEAISDAATYGFVDKAGTQPIQVKDLRGGFYGYKLTAKASDLKATFASTDYVLPVNTLTMTTPGNSAQNVAGVTNVSVKNVAGYILNGGANSNGITESTATASLNVVGNVKATTYTGTITYTLSDANLTGDGLGGPTGTVTNPNP